MEGNCYLKEIDCFQVEQKPAHKSQHQENHVSQIGKSIVSQANHAAAHGHHGYGSPSPSGSPQHELPNGLASRNGHGAVNGVHYQKNGKHGSQQQQQQQQQLLAREQEWRQQDETGLRAEDGLYEGNGQPPINDGKHSLLQYAMLNFRQSTDK